MKTKSFKGQHFIIHLNTDMGRLLNKNELKDCPYNLMVSSEYVYPPMTRDELKGLADFILNYLENN
jgi:hypothetical protein